MEKEWIKRRRPGSLSLCRDEIADWLTEESRFDFREGQEIFIFCKVSYQLWDLHSRLFHEGRGHFPWVPTSNAEVNEWSPASVLPYACMALFLIKHKVNFTFCR
jgi:hypothetical protein